MESLSFQRRIPIDHLMCGWTHLIRCRPYFDSRSWSHQQGYRIMGETRTLGLQICASSEMPSDEENSSFRPIYRALDGCGKIDGFGWH